MKLVFTKFVYFSWFFILNCLTGMLGSSFLGLVLALLSDITTSKTYLAGYTITSLLNAVSCGVGPTVAGIIVKMSEKESYWVVIAISGCLMMLSSVFAGAIRVYGKVGAPNSNENSEGIENKASDESENENNKNTDDITTRL